MLKRKNLDSEEKYKSIVEIVVSNNSKTIRYIRQYMHVIL